MKNPCTESFSESQEMVDLAYEKKILLAVILTRRWRNSFILAKKLWKKEKSAISVPLPHTIPGRFLI